MSPFNLMNSVHK